jgi:hypothetical protein
MLGLALESTRPFSTVERLVTDVSYTALGNALYSRAYQAAAAALNYLATVTPVPYMTSVTTFKDGGVGIVGDDRAGGTATWFLAPYTTPDSSSSSLGLYYKGSGVAPVLVHNFVVNIPGLDGVGITPPLTPGEGAGVFRYDGNQGAFDPSGAENPPHLKPVWTLTDGGLGISTPDSPSQWFLAPYWDAAGDRSSLGVYYRAADGTCHLVHDFVLDVAAIRDAP